MNTAITPTWIPVEDPFPPLDQTVLVAGVTSGPTHADAVLMNARLMESWERLDTEGARVYVWADEDEMEERAFDPTH